ncbi:hypothetical protein OIU77_002824 [Salix suchowensis]|uniref:Pectinesterase inhibitor domain-containing protein n=1 Tax=Salix suchowensis TaxID=1278906 RepID=A0ABQ9AZM8_9ROSI|nr:hypothetical protein OIU77_002824 [Salix suchowensis]
MRPSAFIFLLLSLVFSHKIFHQPSVFVNGDMKLIQETCKNTKYYDLCVSSLKPNASSTKADTKDKYGYAADALQDSVQDLATDSYDYAYMHVMGASDYPNACRNAFKRYPGLAYPSELARREDGLKHICDVVLGMIDHLSW